MTKTREQRVVGVDVSAAWLDGSRGAADEEVASKRFANTPAGHRALSKWVTQRGRTARVVLEATGLYSFDVALALHRTAGVEVMVVNPRASQAFAAARLQRARTDATAATVLREFAACMPFTAWQPPDAAALALRTLARRIVALVEMRVQEKNRLHAWSATGELPAVVCQDLRHHIRSLTRQIARLEREARARVDRAPALQRAYAHLRSVRGIGRRSALLVLAELATLPAGLTPRQWVAHAGLDPRPIRSGSSVHPPVRISKLGNVYLRRALFMPALVAMRHNPAVQRFAGQLSERGKKPLQILVAIMRKLLHAIHGMLRTDTDFDGLKFRAVV